MDWKLLIALTALLVVVECKKFMEVGRVDLPIKMHPPCEKKFGKVCRWGCKAQRKISNSLAFTMGGRGRRCLNCECKTADNGLKYTFCIKPHCDPVPKTCKKVSHSRRRCCATCLDKENVANSVANSAGFGNTFGGVKPAFTFPPPVANRPFTFPKSEFGGGFPGLQPFGDELEDAADI